MKLSIFILSLVLILSTRPRLNAQEAEDSEQEVGFYTENVLTKDHCRYDKEKGKEDYRKGIDANTLKILETFIDPVVVTKEDGTRTEEKGSLTVDEDSSNFGKRVFNFEKLQAAIIAEKDVNGKECLRSLFRAGITEWKHYYNNLSKKYDCGVEIKTEDKICGYKKNINKYLCEDNDGENNLPEGMTIGLEKESARNYEKLHLYKGEKKNTCTKIEDGEDLEEYISDRLMYIAEYNNNLFIKDVENNKHATENSDKPSTEAGLCPKGERCDQDSAEQKTKQAAEAPAEKLCCDTIKENWVSLGFAVRFGSEPTQKECDRMLDKNLIGEDANFSWKNCGGNMIQAIGASAYNTFTDFFSIGWISNIYVLAKELFDNFPETVKKIGFDMFGYDQKLMAECVNDKTYKELWCSMIGKFVGANIGAGIFMGGAAGVTVSALSKAAKLAAKTTKTKNSIITKLAKNPAASKGIFATTKAVGLSAAKGGLVGFAWPKKAIVGAGKLGGIVVRNSKGLLVGAGNATVGVGVGATGIAFKGVSKSFSKDTTSVSGKFGTAFSDAGDSLKSSARARFESAIKGGSSKTIKEIQDLQTQINTKTSELAKRQKRYDELTSNIPRNEKGGLKLQKEHAAKKDEIFSLERGYKKDKADLQELQQKIKEVKTAQAVTIQKQLIDEQKAAFSQNVEAIKELKRKRVEISKQLQDVKTPDSKRQEYGQLLKQSNSEIEKLTKTSESLKRQIRETTKLKASEVESFIFNTAVGTGVVVGTGALQVEKMKGSKQKSEPEKSSVEKDETKKVDGIPVPTAPPPGVAAPAQPTPAATTKKEEPPPKATVVPSAKQTEPVQMESGETKPATGAKEFAPPPPMD